MAAYRSRRSNAGAKMAGLMKGMEEDDAYKTLWGGFSEDNDEGDFDLGATSDEGSDVDIATSEDEDLQDEVEGAGDEDDDTKRRKRKLVKKPVVSSAKRNAVKSPVETTAKRPRPMLVPYDDDLSTTDEEEANVGEEGTEGADQTEDAELEEVSPDRKKKKVLSAVIPSGRSIRDSTAAKRFETEELEIQRELRRQEAAPRKKIRHRVPTQQERLSKIQETEKKNRADLAKYQRDEEENEKKKAKKQKVVRGPFDICAMSTTVTMPLVEEVSDQKQQALLKEAQALNGHQPGERFSRSTLCFRTEDLFREAFPVQSLPVIPEVRNCIVTGKPAKYRDPLTLQYYYDAQALQVLHDVLYKHLLSNATSMGNAAVLEFIGWFETKYKTTARQDKFADVGKYDFSSNETPLPVNGESSSRDELVVT